MILRYMTNPKPMNYVPLQDNYQCIILYKYTFYVYLCLHSNSILRTSIPFDLCTLDYSYWAIIASDLIISHHQQLPVRNIQEESKYYPSFSFICVKTLITFVQKLAVSKLLVMSQSVKSHVFSE